MDKKRPVKDFYEDFESVWEEQYPVRKDVFSDPSEIDLHDILLDALRSV